MGRITPPPARPTYEELQAIIERKNKVVDQTYWDFHTIWSISWLAAQAHCSSQAGFDDDTYAEAMAYTMKHIAEQANTMRIKMEQAHLNAGTTIAVASGEA